MKSIFVYLIILAFCSEGFSQKYLLAEDVNKDTIISNIGFKRKYYFGGYFGLGLAAGPVSGNPQSEINYLKSFEYRDGGMWGRIKLNKRYALGMYVEYSRDVYRMKSILMPDSINYSNTHVTKQINNNIIFGLFNRINITSEKLYIDLGGYFSFDLAPRIITKIKPANGNYKFKKTVYSNPSFMNRKNFGIDAKLTYGYLAMYGRYRITSLYKNKDDDIPKFMIGLLIEFH